DHGRHEGSFAPAVPLFESAAIVTLLRASLDARPPHGRVTAVTVRARPVRVPPAQSSLIDPSRSSPRLVAAALARVAALVGAQQIGVPALVDSHRPDAVILASYHFCDAPPPAPPRSTAAGAVPDRSDRDSGRPALAFRRFRP